MSVSIGPSPGQRTRSNNEAPSQSWEGAGQNPPFPDSAPALTCLLQVGSFGNRPTHHSGRWPTAAVPGYMKGPHSLSTSHLQSAHVDNTA